jgi:ABC-type dipeptide/oligopeptide/nickel transport system permease component
LVIAVPLAVGLGILAGLNKNTWVDNLITISVLSVVENMFNCPGMERLLAFAINRSDLPLIRAIIMVTVLGFALANLVADLLYAVLNPRTHLGE